jgi:hypothetical protein
MAILAAFSGAASAQVAPRGPLVGYVDRTGTVTEPATYEGGSLMFRGDWVAVSRGGKAGYLNLRTRATTGLVFDQVADDYQRVLFAHGPEPVRVGGKWGYADESGAVVIAPAWDEARGFAPDGLAIVANGSPRRFGFVDRAGRVVVEPKYDLLWHHAGGMAGFRKGALFGALDRDGREAIPARFGWLGRFGDNGRAPATLKGSITARDHLFGYVDRTGRFVIPETFVHAGSFHPTKADGGMDAPDGLAKVLLKSGGAAYINSAGEVVTRFPAGINVWGVGANGLARFQDPSTGRYGFADRSGAIRIPARFEQAGGFDVHGLSSAQENNKAGYIDGSGAWAIAPRFTGAGSFDGFGQAQAVEGTQGVLIDRAGKVVATVPRGVNFYWQESGYAAFRTYPQQVDYPPERFGAWRLDRVLYAVPETASLTPTATGRIALTLETPDGLLRFHVRTEGWGVELFSEQGPAGDPDVTRSSRLGAQVPRAQAVIAHFAEQLTGTPRFSIAMTPAEPGKQAAQRQRLAAANAKKAEHVALLRASTPDLERAIAAMRARVAEQFGRLSGWPCMPPQCLY